MKIVTIPDDVSREEFIKKVQTELGIMRPHSKALVLLNGKTIPYSGKTIQVDGHMIRYVRIGQTLSTTLRGAMADVIAIETTYRLPKEAVAMALVILNDHADDHGVLICPAELEEMLKDDSMEMD